MAMITCTYCGEEISSSEVEAEDGHCPVCGAIITLGRSNFGDEEDELDEIDSFDEDEIGEEDIFEKEDEDN